MLGGLASAGLSPPRQRAQHRRDLAQIGFAAREPVLGVALRRELNRVLAELDQTRA
jgi:hypothetical protein